jgi:hypothetical protein
MRANTFPFYLLLILAGSLTSRAAPLPSGTPLLPKDIYEQAVVKGRTGVKRDLFKHLFGVIAPDAPFHIIRCRPHSPLRPEIGQVFRTRSDS